MPNRVGFLRLAERMLRAAGDGGAAPGALPSAADIGDVVEGLITAFFPGSGRRRVVLAGSHADARNHLADVLGSLEEKLEHAVYLGLHRRCGKTGRDGCGRRARAITARMLRALPEIRTLLGADVRAALDADPAATGADEIVACYPGLYAVAVYRAAHRLLGEGAEIVPRMMTEHAHSCTGIDIHPGAAIGSSFFIDHGTGIVIGETTTIGSRVRIYQGVTLGALSVRRGRHGAPRPHKRHPSIEDDVVIYANATILGGGTVIGRGAVVGGNAFITYSVPPGLRVGVGS